jgi:hypothetical protein
MCAQAASLWPREADAELTSAHGDMVGQVQDASGVSSRDLGHSHVFELLAKAARVFMYVSDVNRVPQISTICCPSPSFIMLNGLEPM